MQAGVRQYVAVEQKLFAALLLPEPLSGCAILCVPLNTVFLVREDKDAAFRVRLNANAAALGGVKTHIYHRHSRVDVAAFQPFQMRLA